MSLYCVPDDPSCPTPVDFTRIGKVVKFLGTELKTVNDTTAVAKFDTVSFMFSFTSSDRFLSVRTRWPSGLKPGDEAVATLFSSADTWNRERYFPTVYTDITSEGVFIVADYIVDVSSGLNDDQLLDNVSAAVSTGVDALSFMQRVVEVSK
ncbi:MAG: YbjN domain-containing protein [Actinomycetaceae bacterium]|nr:YbjN domain-containing protein [Actinomycetaceae bacterium]